MASVEPYDLLTKEEAAQFWQGEDTALQPK